MSSLRSMPVFQSFSEGGWLTIRLHHRSLFVANPSMSIRAHPNFLQMAKWVAVDAIPPGFGLRQSSGAFDVTNPLRPTYFAICKPTHRLYTAPKPNNLQVSVL